MKHEPQKGMTGRFPFQVLFTRDFARLMRSRWRIPALLWITGSAMASGQDPARPAEPARPVYVCPPCGCASDSKSFDAPGVCPDCRMGLVRKGPTRAPRNVAIVLFDGVEILDFSGPAEVFSAARGPNRLDFEVFTVAATREPVESGGAVLTITPEYSIENCPKPDIVVIPGGGVDALTRKPAMMNWIRQRASEAEVVLSVCNGAFVLAESGLLDGLEATTHASAIEALRRRAPKVRVVADRRFVDNGKIVTAAGVSAEIDASLHIVERFLGPEAADNTAAYMEYQRRRDR